MQSCASINGKYLQVGPPAQSSQAATHITQDTMWNQQDGTASNSYHQRTLNTGVRPPQSAPFTFCNTAYSNGQMLNFQTLAVPLLAVSSQQLAVGKTNTCYQQVLQGNPQNSFANIQSGNMVLLVANGLHGANQQNCYPNSVLISSSTQSPPNMLKAKSTYPQQDMSMHWNQQGTVHGKQSLRTQDGNVAPDVQPCRTLKSMLQIVNGKSTKPTLTKTATASWFPHKQVACTSTLVSGAAHNKQTAHNKNHRQNALPSCSAAISQSFRNKSITACSSSSKHILPVSSMSPKTQQYPVYLNSIHNNREEATHRFLSKTNELPSNPSNTQEQMLSPQMIARIADNPSKSLTVSSGGCSLVNTSSSYRGQQLVSEVRMTKSNQNMQPVMLTGYNPNASRSRPLSSELSLSKTTHSVMSTAQHTVPVPQQSSAPNAFCVTATADRSENGGRAATAVSPKSNKGNLVGSLKLPENISQQRDKTESSVANNCEVIDILEMLLSAKANDGSIHSSPGHTGTRAVVQPLSQESYQVSSKQTSSNTISQSAEHTATDECLSNSQGLVVSPVVAQNKNAPYLREGSNLYPENPNQIRSNKSGISHSVASSDGTFVSSSDSDVHQDVSQQLCAEDTRSELTINMQVDQHVALTAQQSVTSEVPVNQNGDQSEDPTDPKALELSSVPTIPWRVVNLIKLIQDSEKAQMKLKMDLIKFDSETKLLSLFWNGNIKNLSCKLKTGWYKDLMTDTREFCSEHTTSDVILSQVKPSFWKQLSNYHVLIDNEVYSELPYKSSWLNVNEQLDDIDKEFGFPASLTRLHTIESYSQPDQVWTVNSNLAQILSEVPNKVLSQTALEPVDTGEETQASTVDATSTQVASPNKTNSADSSDPYYSFEIQVLPPEEAKRIFEKVQAQTMDTDGQPETVKNNSKLKKKKRIEQVCCISKWIKMKCGPDTPISDCQCKNEQSLKDCAVKTLDKKETTVQKEDNMPAIRYDSKFHTEGDNKLKGKDNIDSQFMTCSRSEPCNELSQTTALTDNDHKSHSYFDKEPKNISQISMNSSQSTVAVIGEDKDLSSCDSTIQSDSEVHCIHDEFKYTGCTQSFTSVSNGNEIENLPSSESEVASQMSDLGGQTQLTCTNEAASSLETEEEQTQISATSALQIPFSLIGRHETVERKRKRLSSLDRFFPSLKKSNKCKPPVDVDSQPTRREVLIDTTDSEPLASNSTAVQLVLFGSAAPQDRCFLNGSRKKCLSSAGAASYGLPKPPEVLKVILSPLRRKPRKTVPTGKYSVKQWILGKRRIFSPTKIRCRNKLKSHKFAFASLSMVSLKKTVGPTNTEELPVSTEMRIWNRNTKRSPSLRRRTLSDRLKCRTEKTKKDAVTLEQPADQEKSNAENGSQAVIPLQQNYVLRFTVLPKTFNFKDGSNGRQETNYHVPNKSAVVERTQALQHNCHDEKRYMVSKSREEVLSSTFAFRP
ncbi:uncharacterized protein si:ch211-106e7.2 [Chelmon rostratus]|uniref:uncharacterized protein si:ch211-106e7.2 n=1 Tax=Chelmon rostratus TaxID=109905 RepID=UPI001BE84543|nr:uncharacterized protein si:ch211-106e7.2 [Chelmon rostratus]